MILYKDYEQKIYTGSLTDMISLMEFINIESLNLIEELTEKTQYRYFIYERILTTGAKQQIFVFLNGEKDNTLILDFLTKIA